jgi:hypothetical protein
MIYSKDLRSPSNSLPCLWNKLPLELKTHMLSFLPHGTLYNVARFVCREFNNVIYWLTEVNNAVIEKMGVVSRGLSAAEFVRFCERERMKEITYRGDVVVLPHHWTFQNMESVLLSTKWESLTTLVIEGWFEQWDEGNLVTALRGGGLRGLVRLELLQEAGVDCTNLDGWDLLELVTLSVNVTRGYRDFMQKTRSVVRSTEC